VIHPLNAAYLMLTSFAVENLLKGALVARNRARYEMALFQTPERKFPGELHSHDLLALGEERLGLVFSNEEKDLLKRLSHCGTWSGRYPVPVRFSELPIWDDSLVTGSVSPDDVASVRRLVARLQEELDLHDPPGAEPAGPVP